VAIYGEERLAECFFFIKVFPVCSFLESPPASPFSLKRTCKVIPSEEELPVVGDPYPDFIATHFPLQSLFFALVGRRMLMLFL